MFIPVAYKDRLNSLWHPECHTEHQKSLDNERVEIETMLFKTPRGKCKFCKKPFTMSKKFIPFTTEPGVGAKPLTWDQAAQFLSIQDIITGEKRGELKTFGPWQIPVTYKALATHTNFGDVRLGISACLTVFGPRTLTKLKESGHCLEGRVSVNGKEYRGFTSSQLLELPNGKLVSVAIIHVCGIKFGETGCESTTK